MVNQRITTTPWHMGLNTWCAQYFGTAHQPVTAAAEWAPFEAHKPERFHHVPAVLVVLTTNTRHLHRGFVGAVELLRTSTSGFKTVLVTDMYRSPGAQVCQWPIEQVVDEALWLRQSDQNWLDYAAEQVVAAQQFYGASYVIAPTGTADARGLVEHLARAYNVLDTVLEAALEVLEAGIRTEAEPAGFRSGWDALPSGTQAGPVRREFIEYDAAGTLTAEIRPGGGSGVLLSAQELADPALMDHASRAGWSTVLLETGASTPGERFLAGAVQACADALTSDATGSRGPVLAALPDEWPALPQAAGTLSRGVNQPGANQPRDDQHGGDAQPWSLHLPGLGSLEFTTGETPTVLAELRGVCS